MGLLQFTLCSICSSQAMPKPDQILERVQDHVKEFASSLPNFICDERITSREVVAGKTRHETVIDSAFIGTQKKDEKGRPFTESREIKAVDGQPAAKNQQPTGSFFVGGGFSSILVELFAQKNVERYRVAGIEKVNGRDALVIKFATRNDHIVLLDQELLGTKFMSKGTGKVWIDRESMQVVRLDLRFLNPPLLDCVLTESIDYAQVVINGKTFWMPRTFRAELSPISSRLPVTGQYIAEYSNYQKFEVSVRMNYEPQN